MPTATLMNQKVREIHFNNDLERKHGTNRQLGSSFSFQVNYSPDGERCVAKLYHSLKDKEDEKLFFLSVEMLGVFKCEGVESEEDKKQIHTQCYDQLFPYMQSEVSHLCTTYFSDSDGRGILLVSVDFFIAEVRFSVVWRVITVGKWDLRHFYLSFCEKMHCFHREKRCLVYSFSYFEENLVI